MDPAYLRALEASPSPQLSRAALWRLAAALETTVDAIAGGGTQRPPGGADRSTPLVLHAIGAEECRALIRPGGVGRVVFVERRGPVALPVNFRTLDDDVVFRAAPSDSLVSAMGQGPISFEVDHIDEALAEGWSVLLSGQAHVVVDPAELEQVRALGVVPWAGGERDAHVRLVAEATTGRRIRQE